MPKQKEKSELEYLRGQCRKLKSENRILKKRNRQLESKRHNYESEYPRYEIDIESPIEEYTHDCPDCGKGTVSTVIELRNKYIEACDVCNYRNVVSLEIKEDKDESKD